MTPSPADSPRPAAVIVVNPSGNRTRVALDALPFTIGRHADNRLVLRDSRASRSHARILAEGAEYFVEDLNSRHGTFVNNGRVTRHQLRNSDRIEFGFPDSYKLIFTFEEDEIHRILDQISASPRSATPGAGNLAKLRALVEVARALQSSLSTDDVLTAVVDAALTITNTERGFLMLREGEDLDVRVARDRGGAALSQDDLQVPKRLIRRALDSRRELLSMNFDPQGESGISPEMSVAALELRSAVCVPLVRVRTGSVQETVIMSSLNDTVGLLYLDSRSVQADLSAGNRELLQTLALEASTILENARLLEEERLKQRMDEELAVARQIQGALLPRSLPTTGWFRAAGSSIPSHQVGGDYYDVWTIGPGQWSAIVADVSGKGVSSALLAALLQGAFLLASGTALPIEETMARVNRFLTERTEGEKYATLFYCTLDSGGLLRWANAGHCKPLLLRQSGTLETLTTTGMPLGMLEVARYGVLDTRLAPGDKVVAFSDGLTEAQNSEGDYFEQRGLQETLAEHRGEGCVALHAALIESLERFTGGAVQSDDITLLVLEYRPEQPSEPA